MVVNGNETVNASSWLALTIFLLLQMARQQRSMINVRSVAIAQSTAENECEEGQATDSV